jgi:hypothetical protein
MAIPKKSPLKAKPLRYPGQSIDDEIQNKLEDFFLYFMVITGFFMLIIFEWQQWFDKKPDDPVRITIICVLIICFYVYKVARTRRNIVRLKMARDGEKVVGQYLDDLQRSGARVLHDIIGENFNIDHVIIARQGLFVVDTKTYSKPIKGQAKIHIENNRVYANGMEIERNPIEQSKALSKWLFELLEESTGKKFPIRPVVVFPGWFVDPINNNGDVWVLNPKALPKFIANEPDRLKDEDIHLITFHLCRYIRSKYQ